MSNKSVAGLVECPQCAHVFTLVQGATTPQMPPAPNLVKCHSCPATYPHTAEYFRMQRGQPSYMCRWCNAAAARRHQQREAEVAGREYAPRHTKASLPRKPRSFVPLTKSLTKAQHPTLTAVKAVQPVRHRRAKRPIPQPDIQLLTPHVEQQKPGLWRRLVYGPLGRP